MAGAAIVLPPLQHMESGRRLFGRSRRLFRIRWRWQRKKKSSSSPASRVQGKKKTHSVVRNNIVSASFFFLTVDEMAPFFLKCIVSFKWELVPKTHQIQNQAFNLRVFCILVLGLGFLQLSP
jgi:hypothetical protein